MEEKSDTTRARTGGPPALKALLLVRDKIAERREAELRQAADELGRAEAALADAEQRCRAQRDRLSAARQLRAVEPAASAAALQRRQAWLARLVADLAGMQAGIDAARQLSDQRRIALGAARQALARARADLDAAGRLWDAWDHARRTLEQRRAEEELADLVAARWGGR